MKLSELEKADMSNVRKRSGMKVIFRVRRLRAHLFHCGWATLGHTTVYCGVCSAAGPILWKGCCSDDIQALTYTVDHNSKRKQKLQLLKNVTGMIAPAQMTALVSLPMLSVRLTTVQAVMSILRVCRRTGIAQTCAKSLQL